MEIIKSVKTQLREERRRNEALTAQLASAEEIIDTLADIAAEHEYLLCMQELEGGATEC